MGRCVGVWCNHFTKGPKTAQPSQHDAADALPKDRHVEVDDESDPGAGQAQVGHRLRQVNRMQSLNRLHLDDKSVFDEDVDPVVADDTPAIEHWQLLLALIAHAPGVEFHAGGCAIGKFREARSEFAMNLDQASDRQAHKGFSLWR